MTANKKKTTTTDQKSETSSKKRRKVKGIDNFRREALGGAASAAPPVRVLIQRQTKVANATGMIMMLRSMIMLTE
jgi:hypothetical protein